MGYKSSSFVLYYVSKVIRALLIPHAYLRLLCTTQIRLVRNDTCAPYKLHITLI